MSQPPLTRRRSSRFGGAGAEPEPEVEKPKAKEPAKRLTRSGSKPRLSDDEEDNKEKVKPKSKGKAKSAGKNAKAESSDSDAAPAEEQPKLARRASSRGRAAVKEEPKEKDEPAPAPAPLTRRASSRGRAPAPAAVPDPEPVKRSSSRSRLTTKETEKPAAAAAPAAAAVAAAPAPAAAAPKPTPAKEVKTTASGSVAPVAAPVPVTKPAVAAPTVSEAQVSPFVDDSIDVPGTFIRTLAFAFFVAGSVFAIVALALNDEMREAFFRHIEACGWCKVPEYFKTHKSTDLQLVILTFGGFFFARFALQGWADAVDISSSQFARQMTRLVHSVLVLSATLVFSRLSKYGSAGCIKSLLVVQFGVDQHDLVLNFRERGAAKTLQLVLQTIVFGSLLFSKEEAPAELSTFAFYALTWLATTELLFSLAGLWQQDAANSRLFGRVALVAAVGGCATLGAQFFSVDGAFLQAVWVSLFATTACFLSILDWIA